MFVSVLRAKLHQACVTSANINYAGSITIDQALLEQAGIFVNEKVLVVDIENGARLETYVIPGPLNGGAVELNGAAARLVSVGDRVIIMAFTLVPFPPPEDWRPRILILDEHNTVTSVKGKEEPSDAFGD